MANVDSVEEWRAVPSCSGYSVSSKGRLRSEARVVNNGNGGRLVPQKILKQRRDGCGYWYAAVYVGRKRRVLKAHVAVAEAFHGPRPAGLCVLHNDGNLNNNTRENLRYGTRAENMSDARRHGTLRLGERCRQAKLTAVNVREIREASGTHFELAAKYGVAFQTIGRIRSGHTWKHVK